ncbi:MAG: hypothetical protein DHS80DRAFT_31001 [Piptocephalis tieghemiana]|nr:MAG: hypothetical protein DHS80DRAFT_31001 [Piptocephalis tieghemiana]
MNTLTLALQKVPILADQVVCVCEELEAQWLLEGQSPEDETWSLLYTALMVSHILQDDLPSARLVYHRAKETTSDQLLQQSHLTQTVWKVLDVLWSAEWPQVWLILRDAPSTPPLLSPLWDMMRETLSERAILFLPTLFQTIRVDTAATYLGTGEDQTREALLGKGWAHSPNSSLLIAPTKVNATTNSSSTTHHPSMDDALVEHILYMERTSALKEVRTG